MINQPKKCNYNLNLVWFNKIKNWFLCVKRMSYQMVVIAGRSDLVICLHSHTITNHFPELTRLLWKVGWNLIVYLYELSVTVTIWSKKLSNYSVTYSDQGHGNDHDFGCMVTVSDGLIVFTRGCISSLTHLCRPVRSTFAVRETASLGIMGAPRVPPLNLPESIVLWEHYRLWGV